MGGFSRAAPPSSVASCANRCIDAKAKDQVLTHGAQQRARAVLARRQTGSVCDTMAREVGTRAARMERYNAALPAARAARDLNELGDGNGGPVNQPCLTRLPLNAAALNRELGIDPNSPNAITDRDLRNDQTGYRAALYRDETNGQIILAQRDTQPDSLVDWKTNIDNGQGRDTAQYRAARTLSNKLTRSGVNFDIAGYSKGGGLAQEAGLVSPGSQVYVFNSAGLHPASLARTGATDFGSLASRTHAFSAENEFLTYMNQTRDPAQQMTNARYLRDQLAGERRWSAPMSSLVRPIRITHLNPANTDPNSPEYQRAREALLGDLDEMIRSRQVAFPPVRAASQDVIPNSTGAAGRIMGASGGGPNLGKLAQHQLSNVVGTRDDPGPMENQVAADRAFLQRFRQQCG